MESINVLEGDVVNILYLIFLLIFFKVFIIYYNFFICSFNWFFKKKVVFYDVFFIRM